MRRLRTSGLPEEETLNKLLAEGGGPKAEAWAKVKIPAEKAATLRTRWF